MKQAIAKNAVDMLHKIESIEKEIMNLKLSVLKKLAPSGKKVIKLKGILKGVNITNEDITSAKRSLYGKIEI
jgi:hypothetical protein